ncbi:MAG: hypothetical protein K6T81_04345 [Alicyclobacillus macrosporangiidus]|uniref:hypothetical protein n=1 Tax=Alicyclobacillus macrosporangiidus TaxID=392015 RepID=UPI0026EC202C|nr:hypothetical protein [Alicyclobacillus macrosporangiidus]MCL6597949.1 hypothetical protein [Alicyclobacillus macrosporangiidus]
MPTPQQVHIDQALTNISVAYIQSEQNFVADKVFPIVPVQKQSDRYFVYSRDDFFRDEAQERAAGTESAGGDYTIDSTPSYFARKYAYHHDVTEDVRVNADSPLQPDQDATIFVSQKLLLKRETLWAQNYFTSGVWGHEAQGVASGPTGSQVLQWDNGNSNPIDDISNAIVQVAQSTGYRPNVLVLGAPVFYALKNHPLILDRIKYTQRGVVTADLLATLLEIEKVVVAWAVKNSAPRGAAANNDFVLGKNALLAYAAPNPGLRQPSAGYIFAWTGLEGAGAYGNRMLRIPMPWRGAGTERVEGEMAFDAKVVSADLGFFFSQVVA